MSRSLSFDNWELLRDLDLDENTKLVSEALYFKFREIEGEIEGNKILILMRCCALVSSRNLTVKTLEGNEIKISNLSISSILKGTPSELDSYLNYLEKLLPLIPSDLKSSMQELIRKTEISRITHKKFKDIWEKIQLTGTESFVNNFMQILWLLVINLKNIMRINSIFEPGYILIGVFDIALKSLEENLVALSSPFLNELCLILKANIDQAVPWTANIENLITEQLQKGNISSKNNLVTGIFSSSVLNKNISLLSNLYQSCLTQEEFDERDLILLKHKIRTPQKPRCLRFNKPHEIIGKVLRWDENILGPNITSKLNEVSLPPASPFIPPPTPMTMAMELNNWFVDLIEGVTNTLEEVMKRLPEYLTGIVKTRTEDMLENTRRVFISRNIGIKSNIGMMFISNNFELQDTACMAVDNRNYRVDELSKFYKIVLSRVFIREIEKNNNIEAFVLNEEYQRGLFCCCLEAVLYLHSVVSINFEEVLDICGTNPFDFWKVINSFSQFDPNIPPSLKRHFREIEVKIISCLAWKEGSKINSAIKALISTHEESNDTNLFLRRLLSHSANRILELSNSLNISETIKEEVWSSFKYLLSDKTELLVNRHVDHMIICTLYGVCKVNSAITFKQIVEKHRQLYLEDPEFFKKVRIDQENYGDIISFYNQVYITFMKDYLIHKIPSPKPRIELLYPASPLRANIPPSMTSAKIIPNLIKSPFKSPFQTPRTQILWAPVETLIPIPNFNISKKIIFDPATPIKKPRIIENLISATQDDIGPGPSLKKDSSIN